MAIPGACTAPAASPASSSPPSRPAPSTAPESRTQADQSSDESRPITRIVLENGLILEDLALGNGSLCGGPDSTITVRYVGTLPDGTVFDSTPPAQPAILPLNRLIDGWREGVPGMRVGGKRRLTIPAELAYGGRGLKIADTYVIPPDTDLVFEIELLGVR